MIYDWRCMCGKENKIEHLRCAACAKQRWSHLSVNAKDARFLRMLIIPTSLVEKIDAEMLTA